MVSWGSASCMLGARMAGTHIESRRTTRMTGRPYRAECDIMIEARNTEHSDARYSCSVFLLVPLPVNIFIKSFLYIYYIFIKYNYCGTRVE